MHKNNQKTSLHGVRPRRKTRRKPRRNRPVGTDPVGTVGTVGTTPSESPSENRRKPRRKPRRTTPSDKPSDNYMGSDPVGQYPVGQPSDTVGHRRTYRGREPRWRQVSFLKSSLRKKGHTSKSP
jgi:hypothetical protein